MTLHHLDDDLTLIGRSQVTTQVRSAVLHRGGIGARNLGQLKQDGETGNGGKPSTGTRVTHASCTCWCERRILAVTWAEIYAGRTRSCGTPRCDRIAQQMEGQP